jgi:hypothetical protein
MTTNDDRETTVSTTHNEDSIGARCNIVSCKIISILLYRETLYVSCCGREAELSGVVMIVFAYSIAEFSILGQLFALKVITAKI